MAKIQFQSYFVTSYSIGPNALVKVVCFFPVTRKVTRDSKFLTYSHGRVSRVTILGFAMGRE